MNVDKLLNRLSDFDLNTSQKRRLLDIILKEGKYDDSEIKGLIKELDDTKQDVLNDSNIKTINGESILGKGNITISGSGGSGGEPEGGYMKGLFEAAGAKWNPNTRFYELNSLSDISEKELYEMLLEGHYHHLNDLKYWFHRSSQRTNISFTTNSEAVSIEQCFSYAPNIKIVEFETRKKITLIVNSANSAFKGCGKLKEILTILNMQYVSDTANMFTGCNSLQNVWIVGLSKDLSFASSPLLSYSSLLFMINKVKRNISFTLTLNNTTTYAYILGTTIPPKEVGGTAEEWKALAALAKADGRQINLAGA